MDQKTIEQKAQEFEMHKERMGRIQVQAMQIQRQAEEIERLKAALLLLKNEKPSSDALIPLGSGVFASGKITETSEVLVMAGAGVAVKKSIPDAVLFLDKKLEALSRAFDAINAEIMRVNKSAEQLAREIEGLASKKS